MMTQRDEVAHRRDLRRLALQMLYQLEARGEEDTEKIRRSILEASYDPSGRFDGLWAVPASLDPADHDLAFQTALEAWRHREDADRLAASLAPEWPTHRQPAMDRNIIRLCWYEMTRGSVPPKAAVNEAIELAKQFGTERSAAFLNGVLDRMMRVAMGDDAAAVADQAAEAPAPDAVDDDESQPTEYWSSGE